MPFAFIFMKCVLSPSYAIFLSCFVANFRSLAFPLFTSHSTVRCDAIKIKYNLHITCKFPDKIGPKHIISFWSSFIHTFTFQRCKKKAQMKYTSKIYWAFSISWREREQEHIHTDIDILCTYMQSMEQKNHTFLAQNTKNTHFLAIFGYCYFKLFSSLSFRFFFLPLSVSLCVCAVLQEDLQILFFLPFQFNFHFFCPVVCFLFISFCCVCFFFPCCCYFYFAYLLWDNFCRLCGSYGQLQLI